MGLPHALGKQGLTCTLNDKSVDTLNKCPGPLGSVVLCSFFIGKQLHCGFRKWSCRAAVLHGVDRV